MVGFLGLGTRRFGTQDWRDEPIPVSRDGLDKTRRAGVVAESEPDPSQAKGEAAREVHERSLAPEMPLELLPADDLAGATDEQQQRPRGLSGEMDPAARFAQLSRSLVELEGPESPDCQGVSGSSLWEG